jgi:hypothetical protein
VRIFALGGRVLVRGLFGGGGGRELITCGGFSRGGGLGSHGWDVIGSVA